MRKKLQKILAVVLAISVTMSLMTSAAFAASYIDGDQNKSYETGKLDEAFANAKDSVTLTSDEKVNKSISVGSGKDIELDLNGNDIQKGANDEVFEVKNGGKLTIDDSSADNSGTIVGKEDSSTSVISVTDGGTLNLEGGTITGNENSTEGGAVFADGSTVNVTDNAVISNNTAHEGGGIYGEDGSQINISGGTITGNHATSTDFPDDRPDGGGGVALVGNGKVTMSGGTISNNVAEGAGGGIGIRPKVWNDTPQFEMTGGKIIGNTAQKHEGGGIRLEGNGSIVPGDEDIIISDNVCNSPADLGGGGIFLVNSHSMTVKNAVITDNHAGGLGGGVAGCIHGEVANLSPDGAAIYGNTADGKNYTGGPADRTDGSGKYGYLPENLTKQPEKAQDFFCAGRSVVGDYMPGGGSAHWVGVVDGVNTTIAVGSAAHATNTMGLTSNATAADIAKIDSLSGGKVIITNNYARNHGGGIATNGDLTFGSTAELYNKIPGAAVDANKGMIKVNAETNKEWATDASPAGYVFELQDASGKVICTATSDANGKIHFDIPADAFSKDGTYTFKMVERAGSDADTTYDDTYYTVEVTVTSKAGEAFEVANNWVTPYTYSVSSIVVKDSEGKALTGGTTAYFTNKISYTPGDTEYVISGTKVVEKAGQYAPNSIFKFDLVDAAGNVLQTQTVTGSGNFAFDALDYTAAQEGTYTYTVVEQELGEDGWTCDKTIYTVTVVVEEVEQGKLQATAEIKKNDETATDIVFTNSYTPLPTGVELTGTKNVNKNSPPNATFKFDLKDADGNVLETEILTAAEMVEHSGAFKFEALSNVYAITEVGTHTYTVVEQVLGEKGWTYDETIYTVTVVVEETVDGKLVATTEVTKNGETTTDIVFSNTFTPDPTGVELTGTKNVNKNSPPNAIFKFDLKDADGNVLETEILTAAEMAEHSGTFKFEALSNAYETEQVGTHTYTVVEQVLGEKGWTYDETIYTVTVVVAETGDGRLVATTSITKNGETTTDIVFSNTFTPDPTGVELTGIKNVNKGAPKSAVFKFDLIDDAGNVLETEILTAGEMVEGAGSFKFEALANAYETEQVGTHTYTVVEQVLGESNWVYDETIYTVTVVVAETGDGRLEATTTITKNGETATEIVFTNVYKHENPKNPTTSVRIPVTKVVENAEAPDSTFEFVLMDENGKVLQTKTLNHAGVVNFGSIEYDKLDVGTHVYKVAEVARGEEGWTYDDTVYTVTVTVTRKNDGLARDIVITDDSGETCSTIVFKNDYESDEDPETSVIIPVKKSVANPDAPASAFEFVLTDENGVVLQTLSLNGAGNLAFDSIAFDVEDVGVHTYKVSEVNRGEEGWTYDDTVYTVTVTVTQEDEALNKSVVITNDDGEVCSAIVFTNDYEGGEEFPLEELGDNGTPLTGLGDDEIPLAEIPATGDRIMAWAMLAMVSGAGLIGLHVFGKKREEENA